MSHSLLLLSLILAGMSSLSGCRTAASLGLPVSSGNHYMLGEAVKIRNATGHVAFPTELAKTALAPHRLQAGDVLVIEPNDFNSPVRIQSDQTVQQDGTIELGAYGSLLVVGQTIGEIQGQIESTISKHELAKREQNIALASHQTDSSTGNPNSRKSMDNLSVFVRLVNHESGKYYVMGEVNAPGSYPMNGSETVLDAIIAAGGLSTNANDHKIILTRPRFSGEPRIILPVCYQQILQLGDVATNYQLQPGDRIYVPDVSLLDDIKNSIPRKHRKSCPQCRAY